jgi:ribosomal protein S8
LSFAYNYLARHNITGEIHSPVPEKLGLIVVIPCHNEPGLFNTIHSLFQTVPPVQHTEVLIIINDGEQDDEKVKNQNQCTFRQCKELQSSPAHITIHSLYYANLSKKHAGAGMARKIGMDQAVCRFNAISKPDGIMISLDADTLVEKNYLTEIEHTFLDQHHSINACNINFEHPVTGSDFEKDVYEAIALYELRMRYYRNALRYAGFPYARHTVGSCFAVKAAAYVKQGGMNRRQGGEDFYFLNKIFPLGGFVEITKTSVFPSPRPSNRVPFGTGPGVYKHISKKEHLSYYYSFCLFLQIRDLLSSISYCYQQNETFIMNYLCQLPQEIQHFLQSHDFVKHIQEINGNVASEKAFIHRFFVYFNAFKIVKFLNEFSKNGHHSNLIDEAQQLLKAMLINGSKEVIDLLNIYRKIDRKEIFSPSLPQL